jgi:hypothetical protein
VISYDDKQFNTILKSDGSVKEEHVDTGPHLGGGRVALRQMIGLKAFYSNFKAYRLRKS